MNILVSVYDKKGLAEFLKNIHWNNHRIYASGGTFRFLSENGIKSVNTSELTGFENLLDGRVKTLHPAIFSGLLSRDNEADNSSVEKMGYPVFHMVICNLYPFEKHLIHGDLNSMVENIDIGGGKPHKSCC